MSKFLLLPIFYLAAIGTAFSQTTSAPRSARFTQEIGIDFAPFVRGQSGASLLYKFGLAKTSDVERRKRFALRALLGYYEDPYSGSTFFKQSGDTTFLFEHTGLSKHQFLQLGTEVQINKKNFRIYFGADLGYRYWTGLSEYQDVTNVSGIRLITDRHQGKFNANVVEGSILAGVNYFFLPRFSVGLEANASAGMEFSNSKTIRNGVTTFTNNNTIIELQIKLFRLLYLSYHFGK